jgi:tetratricopeptide (TPR) repeat protein
MLMSLRSLSLTPKQNVDPFRGLSHRTSVRLPVVSNAADSRNQQAAELVTGDIAWHSLVGQADRAFRLGIQLEKNGQARKASAAFHEAVTLYQCFLDSKSEFGHVTSLPDEDCPTILAYGCLRLGFLNLDALGDPKAAVRLYKEAAALDPFPSAASYEGLGHSLEASQGGKALEEAVEAYRTALKLSPGRKSTLFSLAVALDRLGKQEEAEKIFDVLRREEAIHACLVDSWGYVRWHTRKIPSEDLNVYRGTRDMLTVALNAARPLIEEGGIVAEFGVGSGRSLRLTQELLPLNTPIHGFDTFTGLPQAWGNEPAGTYSTGGMIPNVEGNVFFHKGLFGDTIAPFWKEKSDESFLAYANIDCDLYSSTLDILESMHGRVIPGTILIFDEYIGHPTWRQDEFRAWRECCKRFGWKYEYLAFSLITDQVVVRVTDA